MEFFDGLTRGYVLTYSVFLYNLIEKVAKACKQSIEVQITKRWRDSVAGSNILNPTNWS